MYPTVLQTEVSAICFQFNKDKYEDKIKKCLSSWRKSWSTSLHTEIQCKRDCINQVRSICQRPQQLSHQRHWSSESSTFSVSSIFVLFLLFKLFSLLYGTHPRHHNFRTWMLAVSQIKSHCSFFSFSVSLAL